jgi:alpha-L-fucosidase
MVHRFVLLCSLSLAGVAQNFTDIRPSPRQLAWQDLEIGVLIHFGPNTFMDKEWGDGTADPKIFNPAQLDAEQWVTAAKAGGARYLVMVAKHHDGFCLWPSRHTSYGIKSSPWREGKGDLVKEVAAACRKHGLKFGVYLSPWDRHEPAYKDNQAYDKFYRAQLEELATRYGELVEFWLDGAGSEGHVYDFEKYMETLRTYQPNTLIFADVGFLPWGDIRWVGNEDGFAHEENWNVIDRHGFLRWRPAEADTPLRHRHWFWHPNDEKSLKSLDELLDMYHKTVGRGAQLVLGLAPDNRGLLPEADVARLKEFGDAVQRIYGKRLAPDGDAGIDGDPDTVWRPPDGSSPAVMYVHIETPAPIDRAVIMEALEFGQQVRKYSIEVQTESGWRTVSSGTTIGHKKIDVFERVTAKSVRLRMQGTDRPPAIRAFQLHDGSAR